SAPQEQHMLCRAAAVERSMARSLQNKQPVFHPTPTPSKSKECSNGEIRLDSKARSQKGTAQDQEGPAAQRQGRQEGQESQASHCHRPLEGPQEGWQGAQEKELTAAMTKRR